MTRQKKRWNDEMTTIILILLEVLVNDTVLLIATKFDSIMARKIYFNDDDCGGGIYSTNYERKSIYYHDPTLRGGTLGEKDCA